MVNFLFFHVLILILSALFAVGSDAFVPRYPIVNSSTPLGSGTVADVTPTTSFPCGYILITTQLLWVKLVIPPQTRTVTAATQVLIVDPRTNKTSTTILRDPAVTTPTGPQGTNAASTRVASLTLADPVAQTNFTTVIAFPTPYIDYEYSFYSVDADADTTSIIDFPSHPIYPPPDTAAIFLNDPLDTATRGLSYGPIFTTHIDYNPSFYQSAFPNLQAVQSCQCGGSPAIGLVHPEVFVNQEPIVSFITATSTSYGSFLDSASIGQSTLMTSAAAPASLTMTVAAPLSTTPSTAGRKSVIAPYVESSVAIVSNRQPTAPAAATSIPTPVNLESIVNSIIRGGNSFLAHVESTATGLDNSGSMQSSIKFPAQTPVASPVAAPASMVQTSSPSLGNQLGPAFSSILAGNPPDSSAARVHLENTVVPGSAGSTIIQTPQPLIIGAQTIYPNSVSAFVISSQTLAPGAPPITLGEGPSASVISLATNSAGNTVVIVGGSSSTIINPTPSAPVAAPASALTIAGNAVTPISSGFLINSQTLAPGGPPITLGTGGSTTVVSLATDSAGQTVVVIGTSSSTIMPSTTVPTAPGITIGNVVATPASSDFVYIVGSQTLAPGHPITLGTGASTTVVALTTNSAGATVFVVGTSSSTITPPAATPNSSRLTIGGLVITPNPPSQYVVGGQTLAPGHPITIGTGTSTTVVALTTDADGETVLVVGTSSSVLTPAPAASTLPPITIGSLILTPNPSSQYVVGGQTLAPGHPITLGTGSSTTVVSLTTDAAGETVVVVGASSSTLTPLATPNSQLAVATTVVLSGSTSITEYIIGSQTLYPGHPITLGAGSSITVIAITTNSAGSTVLVVGGTSTTLSGVVPSSSSTAASSTQPSESIPVTPLVGASGVANGGAKETGATHSAAAVAWTTGRNGGGGGFLGLVLGFLMVFV